jgi:hypothetical protein
VSRGPARPAALASPAAAARAASGHATTAPLSRVMNSRRFLSNMGLLPSGRRPNNDSTSRRGRRLLRCGISTRLMTAVGHKQTSHPARTLSALPLKADKAQTCWHVRLVPKTDSCGAANSNLYSITSLASASSLSGIARPSALAVVRLRTNSNLVGRSTGISLGFVPCRILSTKSAARRNRSGKFGP